jgi:hypothetical protein
VPAPQGTREVPIVDPAGSKWTAAVTGDGVEVVIRRAGFYRVGDATLAANASDAVESDTAPVRELALGGRALSPPDPPRGGGHRPISTFALWAAALLLVLEWVTTHRRWTV